MDPQLGVLRISWRVHNEVRKTEPSNCLTVIFMALSSVLARMMSITASACVKVHTTALLERHARPPGSSPIATPFDSYWSNSWLVSRNPTVSVKSDTSPRVKVGDLAAPCTMTSSMIYFSLRVNDVDRSWGYGLQASALKIFGKIIVHQVTANGSLHPGQR